MAALVGPSLDGGAQPALGPRFGSDFDRGTVSLVVLEEALCGMLKIGEVGEISSATPGLNKFFPSQFIQQFNSIFFHYN